MAWRVLHYVVRVGIYDWRLRRYHGGMSVGFVRLLFVHTFLFQSASRQIVNIALRTYTVDTTDG